MTNFYVAFQTRSQAFLLERRLKCEGIECELAFVPREIMRDLCNLGVKFSESEYRRAVNAIRKAGIPGCRVYKEVVNPNNCQYLEDDIWNTI